MFGIKKRRIETQWKILVKRLKRAESKGYKHITICKNDMEIRACKLYKENIEALIRKGVYIEVVNPDAYMKGVHMPSYIEISWHTKEYRCVYSYCYPNSHYTVFKVNEGGQLEEEKLTEQEYEREYGSFEEERFNRILPRGGSGIK